MNTYKTIVVNRLFSLKRAIYLMAVLCSSVLIAQNGAISGSVTSSETGAPLPGANVLISGSVLGASTNSDGKFNISSISPGSYMITVLYVGYQEAKQTVTVTQGQTVTINFSLVETGILGQTVVVSASRKPEKITEAPATIEVLTAKEIAEYPSFNAGELLGRIKGVDYFRAGVLGTGINIRGFNSTFNSKNLQMTDGRVSTLIGTGLPLGILDPTIKEDVDHIEVILGPNAALYGPNAHNGLVNTITKDPRSSEGTTVVFGGGNQSVLSGRFRHAQVLSDKFAFKVNAEYTEGQEFEYTDSVYIGGAGFTEFGLDRDFNSLKGGLALYFSPSPTTDLILSYGGSNSNNLGVTNVGRNQIIDWQVHYIQARFTTPHLFGQVYYTISKTDSTYSHDTRTKNYHRLLADTTRTTREAEQLSYTTPSQALFKDDSRRWNAELQYNNNFNGFNVVVGGQWQRDIANSEGTYLLDNGGEDAITFDQVGVYAQVEKGLGGNLKAILTARGDNHEVYDFNFLPKAGLVWNTDKGTWRLTYGKGIASPTILNLEGDIFSGIILGNSEGFTLADGTKIKKQEVEKIQTFEMGYKGVVGNNKLFIDANAYYNISEDFLSPTTVLLAPTMRGNRPISDFQPVNYGFVLTYVNFGKVNTYGFDLGLNYYINRHVNISANYSFFNYSIDKDNLAENDFNKDGKVNITDVLVNTPKNKANGGIFVNQDKFFGNVYARWVEAYDFFSGFNVASKTNPDITWRGQPVVENARVADTYNYGPLGDFVSFDISAGVHITPKVTASLLFTNLFDSKIREMVVSPFIGRLVSGELKVSL